jgi:hypothetical protein
LLLTLASSLVALMLLLLPPMQFCTSGMFCIVCVNTIAGRDINGHKTRPLASDCREQQHLGL